MKKTVLFDSFAWIELMAGTSKGKKVKKLEKAEIIISTINIFEVYAKAIQEYPALAHSFIDKMLSLSKLVPVSAEIALKAAELRKKYRFSMADAIILATAIQEKAVILTENKDFRKVTETKIKML